VSVVSVVSQLVSSGIVLSIGLDRSGLHDEGEEEEGAQ